METDALAVGFWV